MSTEPLSLTPNNYATTAFKPVVALLPRLSTNEVKAVEEADSANDRGEPLTQAVGELNRYVAGTRTDLRFAVDTDAGQLVVSIIDAENGQVLRQMPSVEALRIARYLEHDRLGLIRQRA